MVPSLKKKKKKKKERKNKQNKNRSLTVKDLEINMLTVPTM